MKKLCVIRQPAGLGDIFFCQKIANKLIDELNFNVLWPVIPQFTYIKDYIQHDNLMFCDINDNFIYKEIYMAQYQKIIQKEDFLYLPLQSASTILGHSEDILQSKYKLVSLDSSDWSNYLTIHRNNQRENDLYYNKLSLKDGEEYILVNNTFASPPNTETINILLPEYNKKIINMKFFADDTLFDWCKVIENAYAIHTVQTSLNYLSEGLNLKSDELFIYQRPGWSNFDYINGVFKKKWRYIQ